MSFVSISEKKIQLRLIHYKHMITNVRQPRTEDFSTFGATANVLQNGLGLIQNAEVTEFQIVRNEQILNVSCKVHAKVKMYILYPVSFSYSSVGIGSRRCECEASDDSNK